MANVSTYVEWIRKGINYFVMLAERLPQHSFLLVGMDRSILEQFLKRPAPVNVEIVPRVQSDDLIKAYSRTKVYVQLSLSEGMPNALCEAMLCECVPVGSNVNGIPNIIGDTGIVVQKQDMAEMEAALVKALTLDKGRQARERIIGQFPPEKRLSELIEVFREAMKSNQTP